VLDHARRELIVVTGGTERSGDFVDLPGRLDRGYGPAPSREGRPVLLVLDDGPIHTGRAARKALAARPRLTVERLPRHAPELNDVERSWGDPKRHSLAHRTFRDADGLDAAIHHAVGALNRERQARACASISRAAWSCRLASASAIAAFDRGTLSASSSRTAGDVWATMALSAAESAPS
jgi:hypothetical protein